MRMDTSKEAQCAEIAAKLRREAARNGLYKGGRAFHNPLDRIAGGIKWKEPAGDRAKQILGLPLVLIVVLVMALYIFVPYLMHRYRLYHLQHEYDKKVETESTSNTFEALWRKHGFDEGKYDRDVCVEAYSKWVEVLYDKKTCDDLNVKRMAGDISTRQVQLNAPYYETGCFGEHPHFYFGPVGCTLLRDVGEQLGEYKVDIV